MTDLRINSEPLTYRQDDQTVSFYRDLWVAQKDGHGSKRDASRRLERHAAEMRVISEEREKRTLAGMRAGDFEYRVEPNRTDGEGGYLAPPEWINSMFATALRATRVLGGLTPRFPLPGGVSSVNLPIVATGTAVQPAVDTAAVPGQDITDSSGSSTVVTLTGSADFPIQMLEQSPNGASLDWVVLTDMAAAYDAQLEAQLFYGAGTSFDQLAGVTTLSGITSVTYTSGSPTGSAMWPYLAQAAAQLADARKQPPQAYLMRSSRWFWIQASEDTAGRPFGLSPFFLGNDAVTPDPIGGIMGLPVFLDEAISATLGGTPGTQDEIICLRPSDIVLFESAPVTNVFREALSGSLGVRIQLHARAAAITRHVTAVATIGGSGFSVQSGY